MSKEKIVADSAISIHALRGEGDKQKLRTVTDTFQFQSTPSVGRATIIDSFFICLEIFQSTPSVGRATALRKLSRRKQIISIHALRGEGDQGNESTISHKCNFNPRPPWGGRPDCKDSNTNQKEFQSTPSVGRATRSRKTPSNSIIISIHALRGEGDCKNIQICNAMLVHSAYKTIYFCDSCAFYLT